MSQTGVFLVEEFKHTRWGFGLIVRSSRGGRYRAAFKGNLDAVVRVLAAAGRIDRGDRVEICWVWRPDVKMIQVQALHRLEGNRERPLRNFEAKLRWTRYGNPDVRGEPDRDLFTLEDRADAGETRWPSARQPELPGVEYGHRRRS